MESLSLRDIRTLSSISTLEHQLKWLVYEYETLIHQRLPACSEAVGHPVETCCVILDVQDVSAISFPHIVDYVTQAISIGRDRYPECTGKYYVINAPRGYSVVWNVAEKLLSKADAARIDILGASYKDTLLKQIDEENLPSYLGGKCDCPGGCSLSDAGPWNPKDELKGKIAKSS